MCWNHHLLLVFMWLLDCQRKTTTAINCPGNWTPTRPDGEQNDDWNTESYPIFLSAIQTPTPENLWKFHFQKGSGSLLPNLLQDLPLFTPLFRDDSNIWRHLSDRWGYAFHAALFAKLSIIHLGAGGLLQPWDGKHLWITVDEKNNPLLILGISIKSHKHALYMITYPWNSMNIMQHATTFKKF